MVAWNLFSENLVFSSSCYLNCLPFMMTVFVFHFHLTAFRGKNAKQGLCVLKDQLFCIQLLFTIN